MPITFPNISIEEAKRQLQIQDRILRELPRGGDACSARSGAPRRPTDPAPLLDGRDHRAAQAARSSGARDHHERWYSSWAPGLAEAGAARRSGPSSSRMTWDELTAEMNAEMQLPGLDQRLDHADQDPHRHADHRRAHAHRHQGLRHRPARDRAGRHRARAPDRAHRRAPAACSTNATWAASTSTSCPGREALARYGLRVGDVQRRHRERHRRRADRHRPSRGATASPSTSATRRTCAATSRSCAGCWCRCPRRRRRRPARRCPWAPRARCGPGRRAPGIVLAQAMPGMDSRARAAAPRRHRAPRLPGAAPMSDAPDGPGRRHDARGRWRRRAAWPAPPAPACPASPAGGGRPQQSFIPLGPARRHPHRRRPAHGARRGRPAGRLRLRRHRSGPARHRRLRRRGQGGGGRAPWPRGELQLPPGLLPQVDRAVRAARARWSRA